MEAPNTIDVVLMVISAIVMLLSIVLLVFCCLRHKKVSKQLKQKVGSSNAAAIHKLPEQKKSSKEKKAITSGKKTRSVSKARPTSKKEKRVPSQKSVQKRRQHISESLALDCTQPDDASVKKSRVRGILKSKPKNFTKVFVCRGSDGEWHANGDADIASEFSFELLSGNSGEDTFPASILEQV
uniref:Uncharacterized protein n=1 Tax=Ditylenchus dipsaci TaxID=166011 RepID=A0A915D164_9BILA